MENVIHALTLTLLAGAATGKARLFSYGKAKSLEADFLCGSTSISGARMGTVHFNGNWDSDARRIDIGMKNSLAGKSSFDIKGSYMLEDRYLDASAALEGLDIACLSPYLSSVFSETSGSLSGTFGAFKRDEISVVRVFECFVYHNSRFFLAKRR